MSASALVVLAAATAFAGCDVVPSEAAHEQRKRDDVERDHETRLTNAIVNQDLPAIDAELGARDLKAASPAGSTLLMFAAEMGAPKSVAHLIGRSDVNAMDRTGATALILASRDDASLAPRERAETVRVLLAHGADPNKRADIRSALMNAAASGNLEMVQALLDAKADPRATRAGRTAAWFSENSSHPNPAVTKLLKAAEGRP